VSDALELLFTIYTSFMDWVFSAEFFTGVSIGWVLVSSFIMSIMIRNIINLPKRASNIKVGGSDRGRMHNNN